MTQIPNHLRTGRAGCANNRQNVEKSYPARLAFDQMPADPFTGDA